MLNANEMSATDQLRGMAKALREAEDRRTGVEVDESQRGAVQRMLDLLGDESNTSARLLSKSRYNVSKRSR